MNAHAKFQVVLVDFAFLEVGRRLCRSASLLILFVQALRFTRFNATRLFLVTLRPLPFRTEHLFDLALGWYSAGTLSRLTEQPVVLAL